MSKHNTPTRSKQINHEGGGAERGRGGDGNMVMAHMMVTAPWLSLTPCAEHLLSDFLVWSLPQPHMEARLLPLLCKEKPETQKGTQSSGVRDGCVEIETQAATLSKQSLGKSTVSQACQCPRATSTGYLKPYVPGHSLEILLLGA